MSHPRRHEADSGPAELRRDAETLPLAHGDIRAQLAWRLQQTESQRLGRNGDQKRARLMSHLGHVAERLDYAESVRIAHDRAQQMLVSELAQSLATGAAGCEVKRQLDDFQILLRRKIRRDGCAIIGP